MASINKVTLLGNLGSAPKVRYMPNGEAVTSFSIATAETWKNKDGIKQERTEWHQIVLYRRLAEIACEYLKKGSSIYIEGRLRTRPWEKDGVTRYTTEIIGDNMQMISTPKADDANTDEPQAPAPQAPAPQAQDSEPWPELDDDDIPY